MLGPRDEASDNANFVELANQTVFAVSQSAYDFAIRVFDPCDLAALEYRDREGREIHKGALCFNVGVAYLRSYGFDAARHYFELAQSEGNAGWDIYRSELFERSFWDTIDVSAGRFLCRFIQNSGSRPSISPLR